jgi:hypothetical protein
MTCWGKSGDNHKEQDMVQVANSIEELLHKHNQFEASWVNSKAEARMILLEYEMKHL